MIKTVLRYGAITVMALALATFLGGVKPAHAQMMMNNTRLFDRDLDDAFFLGRFGNSFFNPFFGNSFFGSPFFGSGFGNFFNPGFGSFGRSFFNPGFGSFGGFGSGFFGRPFI